MTKPDYDPIIYRYAGIMLLAVPDGVEIERLNEFPLTIGRPEYWTGMEWCRIPLSMDGSNLMQFEGIPFRCLRTPNAPQYVDHNIRQLNNRCDTLEARVNRLTERLNAKT